MGCHDALPFMTWMQRGGIRTGDTIRFVSLQGGESELCSNAAGYIKAILSCDRDQSRIEFVARCADTAIVNRSWARPTLTTGSTH